MLSLVLAGCVCGCNMNEQDAGDPDPAATPPHRIDVPQVPDRRKTIQFPHPVPSEVRDADHDAVISSPRATTE